MGFVYHGSYGTLYVLNKYNKLPSQLKKIFVYTISKDFFFNATIENRKRVTLNVRRSISILLWILTFCSFCQFVLSRVYKKNVIKIVLNHQNNFEISHLFKIFDWFATQLGPCLALFFRVPCLTAFWICFWATSVALVFVFSTSI